MLLNHAYYNNENFSGDSMGLEYVWQLNFILNNIFYGTLAQNRLYIPLYASAFSYASLQGQIIWLQGDE